MRAVRFRRGNRDEERYAVENYYISNHTHRRELQNCSYSIPFAQCRVKFVNSTEALLLHMWGWWWGLCLWWRWKRTTGKTQQECSYLQLHQGLRRAQRKCTLHKTGHPSNLGKKKFSLFPSCSTLGLNYLCRCLNVFLIMRQIEQWTGLLSLLSVGHESISFTPACILTQTVIAHFSGND